MRVRAVEVMTTAYHDGGEGLLDFGSYAGGDGHGRKPIASVMAVARTGRSRSVAACFTAVTASVASSKIRAYRLDENPAVEHGDAEEGDESYGGTDAEQECPEPQGKARLRQGRTGMPR